MLTSTLGKDEAINVAAVALCHDGGTGPCDQHTVQGRRVIDALIAAAQPADVPRTIPGLLVPNSFPARR